MSNAANKGLFMFWPSTCGFKILEFIYRYSLVIEDKNVSLTM
jgi:hypothetical protein